MSRSSYTRMCAVCRVEQKIGVCTNCKCDWTSHIYPSSFSARGVARPTKKDVTASNVSSKYVRPSIYLVPDCSIIALKNTSRLKFEQRHSKQSVVDRYHMAPIKRLIVCCDGTWNDSISTNNPLTNVARFSRCVEDRTEDDILQIVYYHTGVGVGTSRISNSIDGAVGRGEPLLLCAREPRFHILC